MTEKSYYLGFALFSGIGAKKFSLLLQTFGSAKNAWEAEKHPLIEVLGNALVEKFINFRKTFSFDKEFSMLAASNIIFLIPKDSDYPQLLKKLPSYPFLLFVKGGKKVLNNVESVGIVGTRKITSYGRQVTEQLTRELVGMGLTTVSGLAMGVDAVVHQTTVDTGGKTIAVLGCGVDCCYPRENQRIYDEILAGGGTIVSTFPPGMVATRGSFPARNAIIAGLSLGVVVTEGAADSGALITASYAKQFGRPVFAVPGPITSALSQGANMLIREGAHVIQEAADIARVLHVLPGLKKDKKIIQNLSQEEQKILDVIQLCPLHFDEIVRTIGKSPQEIGSILSLMELKGLVSNNQGTYIKIV